MTHHVCPQCGMSCPSPDIPDPRDYWEPDDQLDASDIGDLARLESEIAQHRRVSEDPWGTA